MDLPLIDVVGHGLDWMTVGQILGWMIGLMAIVIAIMVGAEQDVSNKIIVTVIVIGVLLCGFAIYCGVEANKYPVEQYYVADWTQINLDELKAQGLIIDDTTHNTITIIRKIK